MFQTACNADLLILDDLGTEFNSSFFLTNLYSLLNNRLGAKLPTIVTTNITDGALLEKLYTEKISSALQPLYRSSFWAVISGCKKPQNKSFHFCRSCTFFERNNCKISADHRAKKKPSAAA